MKNRLLSASFASCLFAVANGAWAANFTVQDIRVNGIERVAKSTVLASVPVRVGGVYQDQMTGRIVRSLFNTGLFDDVKVQQSGNVLFINVKERMAVGSVTYQGNRKLSDAQLDIAVRKAGVRPGQTLNRANVAKIKQEIQKQYQAAGIHAVGVNTQIENLGSGRAGVKINISEGSKSKISRVRITGNRAFPEAELLRLFESGPRSRLNFLSTSDNYSKEKLTGDLEKLTSFYRDRGYINFQVVSPNVRLSDSKKDILIDIKVKEGDQYRVGNINLAGTGLSAAAAKKAMKLQQGKVFSQKLLEESRRALRNELSQGGFANTRVNIKPSEDKARKLIHLTFQADKGVRTYVRRIQFRGHNQTQDVVFRREMRQLESSWLSRENVIQSKRRLTRLPFVAGVQIKPVPVAGARDQVDLEVTIKEQLSNQFTAGVGYSQNNGVLFNVGLKQQNFLGTGKEIGVKANHGGSVKDYSLTFNNPYHTVDGVGRGFKLFYNDTDYDEDESTASYLTNSYGASGNYTFPLTESDSLRVSLGAEHRTIKTTDSTPDYINDFIAQNGSGYNQLVGNVSYVHDTRNKRIFPTEGNKHSFTFETGLPSSDLSYYKLRYRGAQYWSLSNDLTLAIKGTVSHGDGLDNLDSLPFFERFYAGGIGSVRGYEKNSLGPQDSAGDALGGDLGLTGTVEVAFPAPFAKDMDNLRMTAFVDAGNVYEGFSDFDAGDIRYSAGVGATWLSPLGALSLSYAKPLNAKDGDDEQSLQFSIGASF